MGATTGPKLDLPDDPELPGCDSVDILFVIDDSGSMSDQQDKLTAAFPSFIQFVQMAEAIEPPFEGFSADIFHGERHCIGGFFSKYR